MKRTFEPGTVVRHFKRERADHSSTVYLYRIIGEAEHSETGEALMIYQALYGDKRLYARPLEMFLGKTDKEKYPDITQEYRFEEADETDLEVLKRAAE